MSTLTPPTKACPDVKLSTPVGANEDAQLWTVIAPYKALETLRVTITGEPAKIKRVKATE